MPKQYEAMRDRFQKQGLPRKAAQGKAARIYNAKHKARPVGAPHKKQFLKKQRR